MQVQLRTWEPNRTNPDGTNPTEQSTRPGIPSRREMTSNWQPSLNQTLDPHSNRLRRRRHSRSSDLLRIELLTPKKDRWYTSVVKRQVRIIDDDQPSITLAADKTSITEGEAVTFTLTRGVNTDVESFS